MNRSYASLREPHEQLVKIFREQDAAKHEYITKLIEAARIIDVQALPARRVAASVMEARGQSYAHARSTADEFRRLNKDRKKLEDIKMGRIVFKMVRPKT